MDENKFLKTMKEYIKFECECEDSVKSELLTILSYSNLAFQKTSTFAGLNYQYWEDLNIRVPIPMMSKAKEYVTEFTQIANEIYQDSDSFAFRNAHIKPKMIELEDDDEKSHDVVFDKIREEIIQGIRNAKYTIWVAVAWFSDTDILQELILKKNQGLSIRIIFSDEDSNKNAIAQAKELFDTKVAPLRGYNNQNRMHEKFCIIDFEFVMYGSYNWSRNAAKNDENWATAVDKDFVREFADEFIKLYNGIDD